MLQNFCFRFPITLPPSLLFLLTSLLLASYLGFPSISLHSHCRVCLYSHNMLIISSSYCSSPSIPLVSPSEELCLIVNYQGSLGAVTDVAILSFRVGRLNQRKLKLSASKLDIIHLSLAVLSLTTR